MELGLLDGSIPVTEVPAAWNAKMQDYLGITPPNDALGCLQDVHWSGASFGYFPTYALGTILSAQLMDTARRDVSGLDGQLAAGNFSGLLGWLRSNIHSRGSRYLPAELVQRVCGEPAQSASYLAYLRGKFRDVYRITAPAAA
jgi:carboxypeptidase Taq